MLLVDIINFAAEIISKAFMRSKFLSWILFYLRYNHPLLPYFYLISFFNYHWKMTILVLYLTRKGLVSLFGQVRTPTHPPTPTKKKKFFFLQKKGGGGGVRWVFRFFIGRVVLKSMGAGMWGVGGYHLFTY